MDLLKEKMNLKAKTLIYFEWWNSNQNSSLQEGEYINSFINSDALIHDSVSFMAEYLCLGKPCCYLVKNKIYIDVFLNKFGKLMLNEHYKAHDTNEVKLFIDSVLNETIPKSKDPPLLLKDNGIPCSKFIYDHITQLVNN